MPDYSAGSASVEIKPDFSGFVRKLRNDLQKVNAGLKVDIEPDVQNLATKLRRELERVDASVEVEIRPNFHGFVEDLRRGLESVDASLDIQVGADTATAAREIAELRRLASDSITLNVDADTRVAANEVEGFRQLAGRDLTIDIRANTSGAAGQVAALRSAASGGIGSLGSAGSLGLGAIGIGQLPAAATALATVGAEIQTLAQAAALLPGIFAGASAAVGTLVIGLQNVGDAFSDDPEKAAEAMDKLADSARETVGAVRSYSDEWSQVQRNIQQNLFAGTAEPIRQMIDAQLPVIDAGMSDIASRFSQGIQLAAGELGNEWSVGGLAQLFRNVDSAVGELNVSIKPLLAGFRTIAVTGSNFLPSMAKGFGDLSVRFGEFVHQADRSGELATWMREGADSAKALASIIGNVGSSLASVFRAVKGDGDGLLVTLDGITERMAEWLGSDVGQANLREFFVQGRDQLEQWKPTLEAVGTILKSLYDATQTWAGILMPFLQAASNLISGNETVVQSLLVAWLAYRTIGPVLTGLIAQIGAFRAASAAASTAGAGALGRSAAGLGAVLGAGGPLGLGLAAAAIGLGFLATKHSEAKRAADEQKRALEALGETLDKQSGKATEATVSQAAGMLEDGGFLERAQSFGVNTQDYVRASLGIDPNAKGAINDQLTQVILSERGSAGGTWTRAAEVTGLSNETIAQALQGVPEAVKAYADAIAEAQLNQEGGFLPTLTDLKDELSDTGESAATLGGEMNRVDSETAKLGESVRRTNEAINGTHQLTEQGRQGFEDLGIAVASVPDAKTVMVNALTEDQQRKLEELGSTVERLPDGTVKITLSDEQARAQIAELVKPETKTITVQHLGVAENKTPQPIIRDGYASGGRVTGGTPGVDSVPIMAMQDEVVFDRRAVNALGGPAATDRFRMALGAGLVRGYAEGGVVGWSEQDEINLQQALTKVTQAEEKAEKVRNDPKKSEADKRQAELAVDEARIKAQELENRKAGRTGSEVSPQAPLPERMSDSEIDRLNAEARVDQANTERNRIYADPFSTEEQKRAADRDYASAQNALEKQGETGRSGDDGGLPAQYSVQGIGARAGAIIGQGILSFFGLDNSILSESNVYNRAINDVHEFYAGKAEGGQEQQAGGYAYQPKNLPQDQQSSTGAGTSTGGESTGGASEHAYDAGGGVEQWRGTFTSVLSTLGMPASWVGLGLQQMQTESGGNPRAINNWDINAQNGTPSKGLMQVIDPTFQSYRSPMYPNDIWDPGANIAASLQYLVARYGGPEGIWGQGHGYDLGGIATGLGLMPKYTIKPERVLSPRQTEAFESMLPVMESISAGLQAPTLPAGLTPRGGDVSTTTTRDHSVNFNGNVQVMDMAHLVREQDRWATNQAMGALAVYS